MDDFSGGKETRQSKDAGKQARRKYMEMLQNVADRRQSEVAIELEDLHNVS